MNKSLVRWRTCHKHRQDWNAWTSYYIVPVLYMYNYTLKYFLSILLKASQKKLNSLGPCTWFVTKCATGNLNPVRPKIHFVRLMSPVSALEHLHEEYYTYLPLPPKPFNYTVSPDLPIRSLSVSPFHKKIRPPDQPISSTFFLDASWKIHSNTSS